MIIGNETPASGSSTSCELFRNEAGRSFSAVSGVTFSTSSLVTMVVKFGDYDNDVYVERRFEPSV